MQMATVAVIALLNFGSSSLPISGAVAEPLQTSEVEVVRDRLQFLAIYEQRIEKQGDQVQTEFLRWIFAQVDKMPVKYRLLFRTECQSMGNDAPPITCAVVENFFAPAS